MFKMPTRERIQEICDTVPEMIAVFSQNGSGYNVRISQMGEFMRLKDIAKELGMKFNMTTKPKEPIYIVETVQSNSVPAFAVVISNIGRYHLAFADEESPVIELTRQFYKPCIEGEVYLVQDHEPTEREIKRIFASGAKSFFHVNTEKFFILH